MGDTAWFEREIQQRRLERKIRDVYREAKEDIDSKIDDFNRRFIIKDQIHRREVKEGKWTQEQYDSWLKGQVFQGDQWEAKRKQITETLYNANSVAAKMANDQKINLFAFNANYQAYTLEHNAGVNFGFGLYDSATVSRLIKENPRVLPMWKIDEPKDYVWNSKNVTNAIRQGIIQGERLDQIAKRLSNGLSTKNMNKMLTFARTAMTEAQNAGRLERLKEAENMGIKVHKEWMATLDEHTRSQHADLDGQKRPLNEPFKVGEFTIMYPGDSTADPSMTYNCRCTMVGDVDDYPSEYERRDNIDGVPISNMSYREWEAAKSGTILPEQIIDVVEPDIKTTLIDKIINSPTTNQMSDPQKAEFKQILDGMTEENLELYNAMTKFHDDNNYTDGAGWYLPSKHKVEMSLNSTEWERSVGRKDATGAWKTKFHEELHQLDHILGVSQGNGQWSAFTKCEGALRHDIINFINNSIDYYNDNNKSKVKHIDDLDKPINAKAKQAFFEYLDVIVGDNKAEYSAFTDAVGLMTRGRINPYGEGYWGHTLKYQKERGPNGATSECFAELGSHILRNDKEVLDLLDIVMPTTITEYKSAIHEIAKYVKSNTIHY